MILNGGYTHFERGEAEAVDPYCPEASPPYVTAGGTTKYLFNSIAENLIPGPRLFQCGRAISQTGGHGDFSPVMSGGDRVGCCGGHVQSLGRTADGVGDGVEGYTGHGRS